ncbi:MAG TPA: protein kinase [Candidatus Eisenbacteria bacterium]|nr:protein kinase [Candidatus Eisenbacteria bacterium]
MHSGTRLGPYEIVSLLGAGGMGEVYRARDSRLGRDVAIKALPASLAHDADRLARFEREARLLASLNHPNIAAIYGLEEAGGHRYLVLEYVEGETLAARLGKGSLSLDETLHVGRDIAAGVEAAHEGGVVHRDLKPGNVMLTRAGAVKVLDFGLAKSGADAGPESGLSASPTMTYGATQAGMVLGTAAYMSPEQARGKHVDRRTDIWSFGCVLYECLCGRPAFEGETVSDLVARILEREPDWSALPARTPARLRDLLRRCVVKDQKQRLRDIGDARVELDQLLGLGTSGALAAAEGSDYGAKVRAGLPWWAVVAIVVVAIGATALIQPRMSRRGEIVARHFEIAAPGPFQLTGDPVECAISPSGRMLAMVLLDSSGTRSLWVRDMNSFRARALPGTNGATQPFWSPDNQSLAFFTVSKLKKIAIAGGDPEVLCDVRSARGGTWGGSGVILFAPSSNGPLFTIPAGGGDAVAVTRLDSTRRETAHRFPHFLPGGRHYLYSVLGSHAGRVEIVAGALGDTSRRPVFSAEGGVSYSASGHLLFTRKGVLSAQRFDPRSLRLSGEPVSLGDAPPLATATGAPLASSAVDGTMAYMFQPLPTNRIAWFDAAGHEIEQVPLAPGAYAGLVLSPDERWALIHHALSTTEFELLVVDLERGTTSRVSSEAQIETFALSPDGKRVAYTEGTRGPQAVMVAPVDGSGPAETVIPSGTDFRRMDGWTPDGKALVIERLDAQTQWDIWILPLEGARQPRPYLRQPANETRARVSPDGRWICYNSDESGRSEGYVQSFPTPGRRYQLTTDGSGIFRVFGWKPDGRSLALGATPNRVVRAVDVIPGEAFRAGPPRPVSRLPEQIFGADIDRDWKRTIAIVPAGKQADPTIRVVLDWPAMIARR